MYMLKIATVDKNLFQGVKGHKTESNAFFCCNSYSDNICLPLSSPMVHFSIGLYGENLITEQSVPTDTMLKVN